MNTVIDEEWNILASLLPEGWRELARETGAMTRARGEVSTPELLLQLLLLHIASGLSLRQTVVRARLQGLANLSDVALLKRLRSSGEWLRELSRRMFESTHQARIANLPEGRRLRALDATTVEEPGATGTSWRVHYSISLPDMACDFYDLSDVHGGESYKRVTVERGDIILGDRGYCRRNGVAHVLQHGGDVIVRLNSSGFPMLEADEHANFDLLGHLRTLASLEPVDWPVRFEADNGVVWKGRLCAVKRTEAAAEVAKKSIRKRASRKCNQLRPETLEFAEYVFVFTTLDNTVLDTGQVLDLYRARWQIELCFKRMKSLLRLGALPKTTDRSARAWIQGKLLTVMLIEKLIEKARLFSPWGFDFAREAQSVA